MLDFFDNGKNINYKNSILAVVAILGVVYATSKGISVSGEGGLDFHLIWVAGKTWAAGANPYGPAFLTQYYEYFHVTMPGAYWVYPPYWYPIAVSLSYWSFPIANSIWKTVNLALLIAATHLIARATADVTRAKYAPIFFIGIAYACFMQATAVVLFNGQTSIVFYFGLAAVFYGILRNRPLFVVIGLVFLALKPQIGAVVFAAVFMLRQFRWTVLVAAGLCLIATIPMVVGTDYRASLEGLFTNLTRYSAFPANTPANLTGLTNIISFVASPSVAVHAMLFLFAAAIVCATAIFYFWPIDAWAQVDRVRIQLASLVLLVASTLFLLPLHTYDIVSLAAVITMISATSLAGRWLILSGLIVCLRPSSLFNLLGMTNSAGLDFPESGLVSLGLLLIFAGAVWAAISARLTFNPNT